LCFNLPENVSTKAGALVEPLVVGLHTANQGNVRVGDKVVILGSGCIGLVTLLACKANGASEVVMVDLHSKRLEYAKRMGANHVINAREEDVEKRIEELFNNRGADVVIETAGAVKTVKQTPFFAKRGGTVVICGIAPIDPIEFSFSTVINKELTIKSVFRYRNLYPAAIAAIADGSIDVEQIVTHEFSFEDAKKAFDTVIKDAENVVKGVIRL